jgi:hypothetical protein
MVLTKGDVANLRDDSPRLRELVARHEAWWALRDADRPLVSVGRLPGLQPHPSGRTHYVTLESLPDRDESIAQLEAHFREHGILNGDAFRGAGVPGAPPMAEVIMGCPCKIDAATSTYWLEQLSGGWDEARAIGPDTGRAWIDEYVKRVRMVAEWSDYRYPLASPSIRGPVDTLSAMLGHQQMIELMLDAPAEIDRVLDACTDLLISFVRRCGEAQRGAHDGSFVSGLFAPGSAVFFNVDAACLFSAEMYRRFFLPRDTRLCAAFEHALVHTHSVSYHHWDSWLEIPNLRIQTVIDPVGPTFDDLLPAMRRVQARRSFLLRPTDEYVYDSMARLSPRGLYVDVYYPW